MLSIELIKFNAETQARAMISESTITDYAEKLKEGVKFPPIKVFFDGENFFLADGFHRLLAHKQAGLTEINEEVEAGTERQAKLFSLSANAAHGMQRTSADKRKAVSIMLADEEWKLWSDNQIAKSCAVSNHLVASLRQNSGEEQPVERKFTDKNGKENTINTSKIGKKSVKEEVTSALDEANATILDLSKELIEAQIKLKSDSNLESNDELIALKAEINVLTVTNSALQSQLNQLMTENAIMQAQISKQREYIKKLQPEI